MMHRLFAVVPALAVFTAGMASASTPRPAHTALCNPAAAQSFRTRADALYGQARYSDAGTAFATAARLSRGCTTPDALIVTAVSLARAGSAFGQSGNVDLGLAQLRLAQGLLSSVVTRYPQHADDARRYLTTIQTAINAIDSQYM